MRHVREHGYPAPEIVSVHGSDLVLERATGPTMRVDLARRIAAPEWLSSIGPGGAVIHLDLHPENVLLHRKGALVIDWANARAGHWADDVAQTVVILCGGDFSRATKLAVRAFVAIYLAGSIARPYAHTYRRRSSAAWPIRT